MPTITIGSDNNNAAHTIVTVTWTSGECIRYTIAPNPTFDGRDAESFEDCMPYNVYITGYCYPGDDLGFQKKTIGDNAECAQQCESEMDAIDFCVESHS